MQKTKTGSFSSVTLATGMTLLILAACTSSFQKDRFMNSFRSFIEETEKYAPEYTYADWERSDSLYRVYADIEYLKYLDDLTDAERSDVNGWIGKYNGLSLKYKSNLVRETVIEGVRDTRDIIRGIKEVFVGDSLQEDEDDL